MKAQKKRDVKSVVFMIDDEDEDEEGRRKEYVKSARRDEKKPTRHSTNATRSNRLINATGEIAKEKRELVSAIEAGLYTSGSGGAGPGESSRTPPRVHDDSEWGVCAVMEEEGHLLK